MVCVIEILVDFKKVVKMTDALNFGPEWLRNLSDGSLGGGGMAPRCQLAEHRYGREEMLALFDRTARAPDLMFKVHGLYVEKIQTPMALLTMTEEETRQWNRGINSDAMLRLAGKAPLGPPSALRGRGGSVDRGRGRARGSGGFHYTRGTSYEESQEGQKIEGGGLGFTRNTRTYGRTEGGDRWAERNGDPVEWNGSTSPRKEFIGRDNWRRHKGTAEDDDAWRRSERPEKWVRTNSWREENDGEPPNTNSALQKSGSRGSNWGRGWADEGVRNRQQEEVPEWATENPSESGGSFDASGAFHGGCYSDDEEFQEQSDGRDHRSRLTSEDSSTKHKTKASPTDNKGDDDEEEVINRQQPPHRHPDKTKESDFDKIRAQHQNFVSTSKTKVKEDKILRESGDVEESRKMSPPMLKQRTDYMNNKNIGKHHAISEQGDAQHTIPLGREGSEEDMERMAAVFKMIDEEENKKPKLDVTSRWYYTDPQGMVQGPFQSTEMLEWYVNGYFTQSLQLRRECDERYIQLGELIKLCGGIPFHPNVKIPKLTAEGNNDVFQFQQVLQKQLLMTQQTMGKRPDNIYPEQNHILLQNMTTPPPQLDPLSHLNKTPHTNPVTQFLSQLQTKVQPEPVDPIKQLMHQLGLQKSQMITQPPHMMGQPLVPPLQLQQSLHLNNRLVNASLGQPGPNAPLAEIKPDDPIHNLLRQLHPQGPPTALPPPPTQPLDSLWGNAGRPQNWNEPPPCQPPPPQPTLPTSLWDMKTEPQILAEQHLRAQVEEEERRKKDELLHKQKHEEEERLRQEEEQRRLEEERNKKEEKKKADERKKQEELKKQEEAQRKLRDKERKKEEEKERKRLAELEKQRSEEEKRQREEEAALKKKQEEDAARRERQEEAFRRLQEQQLKAKAAPWSQTQPTGTSLAEIQKLEKEKKQQQLREQEQQVLLQKLAQQNELQHSDSRSNGLNLKWAEQASRTSQQVKSLAEIQAEEQKQLQKQLEKERQDRLVQQREAPLPPTVGIWGTASQSLSWANPAPWATNPPNQTSVGFWDDVPNTNKTKKPISPVKAKPTQNSNLKSSGSSTNINAKASKSKSKKEEAAVLKLFEVQGDEFSLWCTKSLQTIQADVDIPTFVGFLRDIESPYDVRDYVKLYLGEGKEVQEFAKQFLERRSKWKNALRNNGEDHDVMASVTTSAQNNDFQEVKGKGKKNKKGKMLKVDSRILGFSVTAAPDRINIGDRDYIDGNM